MQNKETISPSFLKIVEEFKKEKTNLSAEDLKELRLKLLAEKIKNGEYEIDEEAISMEMAKYFDIDENA